MTGRSKKRKMFIRRCLLLLIGLFLGVSAYSANARIMIGNELPMPFGYGIANVMSGSMEPTFSKGALLLVKEMSEIHTGDIVVYQSGSMLVSHRVVEMDGDTVITKGDANNTEDESFDRSLIKGKVIGWVPGLGDVAEVLKKPTVSMFLFAAAFFLSEITFRREREEDERKKERLKEEIRRLKEERGN